MISVTEAHLAIENTIKLGPTVKRQLATCLGMVLAEDIYSPFDFPSFDQAAMDGFAFDFKSFGNLPLQITCEIAAGDNQSHQLSGGMAARIFTGARIPKGSDAVVMKEKCVVENEKLHIQDHVLQKGMNVRLAGSVFKKGALVFSKGIKLSPGSLGVLASLGIAHVLVFQRPILAVLTSGSEISALNTPYKEGIIYDSNAIAISAAIEKQGIDPVFVGHCADDALLLKNKIASLLETADFLLLSGGMSVGDYDFSVPVLEELGIETVFWKVKQKPGKPFYFGKQAKSGKYVFGLPGNPAAALTCFYEYIIRATDIYQGIQTSSYLKLQLPLAHDYQKKAGLVHFLKARIENNQVFLLEGQESHRLEAFAMSNCLAYVPEELERINQGEAITISIFQ